jgi:hypothetical protein
VAGDFYNECYYILRVEEETADDVVLTLLCPISYSGFNAETLKSSVEQCTVGSISGWTMFSEEDARIVNQLCTANLEQLNALFEGRGISPFQRDESYLYEAANETIKSFSISGEFKTETVLSNKRYQIRGVKKISILSR